MLAQLQIGLFYNIFVSIILGITSFVVAYKVTPRFLIENDRPTFYNKYLRYFWMYTGFGWITNAVRLFFNVRGDIGLDKFSFYIYLILTSVSVLFLLLYSISVLFHKYDFSTIIAFFGALLSGAFLFFTILEGIVPGESSIWNSSWYISSLSQDIFMYGIFSVVIFVLSFVLLRELFYVVFQRFTYYSSKHIYSALGIILYLGLFLPDFFGVVVGHDLVLMRAFLLIPMLLIYYRYSGVQISIIDHYVESLTSLQKVYIRKPLLLKAVLLIAIVSIIPLFFAAFLLRSLFANVFSQVPITSQEALIQYVQGQLNIVVVVIGVLTFFLGVSWARAVVMRLRIVFKGTQEISQGNFEYRIEEIGAKDEIRLLAHLFNGIGNYLQHYKAQVIETSEGLEENVNKQTIKLEQKSAELDKLAEQNQKIVHQLEARSEIIFENMGDGLLLLEDDFTIAFYNSFIVQKFNIKSKNLLEMNLNDVAELITYDELVHGIEEVKSGSTEVVEVVVPLHAPLVGEVELRISEITLRSGKSGYMILVHDLSPPWGIVRDSKTLQPIKLAMVRLIDEKTQRIIDTEVTDPNGRFGFFVSPGRYFVNVVKDGFYFPSQKEGGYKGEVIDIKNRDEGAIKFDIFMDALEDDSGEDDNHSDGVDQPINTSQTSGEVGELLTVQQLLEQQKNNT